jgi:hypothetical protein
MSRGKGQSGLAAESIRIVLEEQDSVQAEIVNEYEGNLRNQGWVVAGDSVDDKDVHI